MPCIFQFSKFRPDFEMRKQCVHVILVKLLAASSAAQVLLPVLADFHHFITLGLAEFHFSQTNAITCDVMQTAVETADALRLQSSLLFNFVQLPLHERAKHAQAPQAMCKAIKTALWKFRDVVDNWRKQLSNQPASLGWFVKCIAALPSVEAKLTLLENEIKQVAASDAQIHERMN